MTPVMVPRKSPMIWLMAAACSCSAACAALLAFRIAAALDLAAAEHFKRARHLADLVAVGEGGHVDVDVAGRKPSHGVADRGQPPHQIAPDVEHADAAGGEEAGDGHDQQKHAGAGEACGKRFGPGFHADFGLPDQRCNGAVEFAQDGDVFVDRGVDPGGGEQFARAAREDAVHAEAETGDLHSVAVFSSPSASAERFCRERLRSLP